MPLLVWRRPECLQPHSVAVAELYAPATGRLSNALSKEVNITYNNKQLTKNFFKYA